MIISFNKIRDNAGAVKGKIGGYFFKEPDRSPLYLLLLAFGCLQIFYALYYVTGEPWFTFILVLDGLILISVGVAEFLPRGWWRVVAALRISVVPALAVGFVVTVVTLT